MNILSRLFRRTPSSVAQASARRPRTSPAVESLEDRSLLSASPFNFHSSLAALSQGEHKLATSLAAAAGPALGTDLPVVQQSLSQVFNFSAKIKQWFAPLNTALTAAARPRVLLEAGTLARLEKAGFTVDYLSDQPDQNGDLLRVHRDFHGVLPKGKFNIGGSTSFDYLDDTATGSLQGKLQASAQAIDLHLEFGVDLVTKQVNGQDVQVPTFFVADTTALSVQGLEAHGQGSGKLQIGSLLKVDAGATADVNLNAQVTLDPSHADHKLRISDFTSPSFATGDVNGTVSLSDAHFTAHLPVLGDVSWSGDWTATITHNVVTTDGHLTPPTYDSVLDQAAQAFITGFNASPLLGQLEASLDKKLPVLGTSVSDLLHLNDAFGWLGQPIDPGAAGLAQLQQYGVTVDFSPDAWQEKMAALMNGEEVDLIHFRAADEGDLNQPVNVPAGNLALSGLFTANVQLSLTPNIHYAYDLGFGVSTTGFYVDSDSHVSAQGDVSGSINGAVKVFGVQVGNVTGNLHLSVDASASLVDPTPDDGRVYATQTGQAALADEFFQALQADVQAGLQAHAQAKALGLNVWSHDWDLPGLVNYHKQAGQA